MGSVHGTLTISFDDDGVNDANREVDKFKKKFEKLSGDLDKSGKGISSTWLSVARTIGIAAIALGGLSGGIQLVAGLVSVVASLAGAVAILPGAFAALAPVIGVLALAKDGFKELGTQLADLKPAWDALKLDVQRTLFRGISGEVRTLAAQYMPDLKTGLTGVAKALNEAAFEFSGFLKQAQTQKDVNGLMTLSAQITRNFTAALRPTLSVLRDVGIVGASVFEEITRGIGHAAEDFAGWVSNIRASGQLREWMLGGVETIKQLIQVVLILGGILGDIFGAFQDAGVDFLGTLIQILQAVSQFLGSLEGQAVLQQFAAALKEIGASVSQFLLASLKELTPALLEALPAFAKLITSLTKLLLPVVEKLAPAIENIAIFIGQNSDAVAGALIALGALAAAFKIAAIAAGILNAILAINPYVLLAVAIVALVALIIVYWDEIVAVTVKVWNYIVSFFKNTWKNIQNDAMAIWQAITSFFSTIGNALYAAFVQPIVDLNAFLAAMWQRIVDTAMVVLRPIIDIITGIFEIIHTIITTVLTVIWLLIQRIWMDIQSLTSAVWGAIVEFLTTIWTGISETAAMIWNPIKDFIIATNQAISDFVTSIWQSIKDFIIRVFGPIVDWFMGIWNRVSGSTRDGINSVMEFINSLPGRILGAVSDAGRWLYDVGKNVVIGFLNGVRDMVGRAVQEVKNMANDIIAGAKSILGIHSPSTVFKVFGVNTMEGYIVGVKEMINPVLDTVASVASNIVDRGQVPPITINPPVTTATTASSNGDAVSGQTVVIEGDLHLHVAGNLDPSDPVKFRETIKKIDDEIRKVGADGRENR